MTPAGKRRGPTSARQFARQEGAIGRSPRSSCDLLRAKLWAARLLQLMMRPLLPTSLRLRRWLYTLCPSWRPSTFPSHPLPNSPSITTFPPSSLALLRLYPYDLHDHYSHRIAHLAPLLKPSDRSTLYRQKRSTAPYPDPSHAAPLSRSSCTTAVATLAFSPSLDGI